MGDTADQNEGESSCHIFMGGTRSSACCASELGPVTVSGVVPERRRTWGRREGRRGGEDKDEEQEAG